MRCQDLRELVRACRRINASLTPLINRHVAVTMCNATYILNVLLEKRWLAIADAAPHTCPCGVLCCCSGTSWL
jgi:hypothetical protein